MCIYIFIYIISIVHINNIISQIGPHWNRDSLFHINIYLYDFFLYKNRLKWHEKLDEIKWRIWVEFIITKIVSLLRSHYALEYNVQQIYTKKYAEYMWKIY